MAKETKRKLQRKPAEPGVPSGPLFKWIADAKLKDRGYNQSQFARDNDFTPGQITNWKRRGTIPEGIVAKVAKGMGITYDAYLERVNGRPKQTTIDGSMLIADYEALPEGLRIFISHRTAQLREYYESCPPIVQKILKHRPKDPARAREWEQDIEADMARLMAGRDKGDGTHS